MIICELGYNELQKRFIVFVFGAFGEFLQQSFVNENVVRNNAKPLFAFADKSEKIAAVEFLGIVQLKDVVDIFDNSS